MISRSDWEPLPTPTLSPFALAPRVPFSVSVFSLPPCGVCLCSAGAVGSFSNKPLSPKSEKRVARPMDTPQHDHENDSL